MRTTLAAAAAATAALCAKLARGRAAPGFRVHNLNFPATTDAATPLVRTVPARMRAGCQFSPVAGDGGFFQFSFGIGDEQPADHATDRDLLESGGASHSILDLRRLGVTAGVARHGRGRPI